jgi:hypothetical protein
MRSRRRTLLNKSPSAFAKNGKLICVTQARTYPANCPSPNSSNMLYPKEDKANSTLQYVCRHCFWSEPASSACIFRNNLNNSVGETAGVTQDVGSDPTVGCEYCFCILCGDEIGCSICGGPLSREDGGGGTNADNTPEEYSEYAATTEGITIMEGRAVGAAA